MKPKCDYCQRDKSFDEGWTCQPCERLAAMPGSEPPLGGRWHAGNGVLVCGTLRIAVASFDTDPPEDFQREVFEWIAEKLNNAQNA